MLNQHHQAVTRAFVLLLFVAIVNGIVGAVAVAPAFATEYSPNGFKVLEASVRRASKSKIFQNYQVKHCVYILSDALKLSNHANENPEPASTHAQVSQFWAQVDPSRGESLLTTALTPIAQAAHKEYQKYLSVWPPATAENPSDSPVKENMEDVVTFQIPILGFFLPKASVRQVWPRHDGPMLFAEAFFRIAWPQASRRPVEYTEALVDLGDFMLGRGYAFGVLRGLFFNRNRTGSHHEFDISPVFTSDRWDFIEPMFLKLARIAYDEAMPYSDMQLDILKVLELALKKKRHQKLHRSRAVRLASHLVTEFSKNTELKHQIYKMFIVEHSLSTHEKMRILTALGHI